MLRDSMARHHRWHVIRCHLTMVLTAPWFRRKQQQELERMQCGNVTTEELPEMESQLEGFMQTAMADGSLVLFPCTRLPPSWDVCILSSLESWTTHTQT